MRLLSAFLGVFLGLVVACRPVVAPLQLSVVLGGFLEADQLCAKVATEKQDITLAEGCVSRYNAARVLLQAENACRTVDALQLLGEMKQSMATSGPAIDAALSLKPYFEAQCSDS